MVRIKQKVGILRNTVQNLIEQFGFQKLSDVPDEKLPELYEKAQVL